MKRLWVRALQGLLAFSCGCATSTTQPVSSLVEQAENAWIAGDSHAATRMLDERITIAVESGDWNRHEVSAWLAARARLTTVRFDREAYAAEALATDWDNIEAWREYALRRILRSGNADALRSAIDEHEMTSYSIPALFGERKLKMFTNNALWGIFHAAVLSEQHDDLGALTILEHIPVPARPCAAYLLLADVALRLDQAETAGEALNDARTRCTPSPHVTVMAARVDLRRWFKPDITDEIATAGELLPYSLLRLTDVIESPKRRAVSGRVCRSEVLRDPRQWDAWSCYWETAQRTHLRTREFARTADLLAKDAAAAELAEALPAMKAGLLPQAQKIIEHVLPREDAPDDALLASILIDVATGHRSAAEVKLAHFEDVAPTNAQQLVARNFSECLTADADDVTIKAKFRAVRDSVRSPVAKMCEQAYIAYLERQPDAVARMYWLTAAEKEQLETDLDTKIARYRTQSEASLAWVVEKLRLDEEAQQVFEQKIVNQVVASEGAILKRIDEEKLAREGREREIAVLLAKTNNKLRLTQQQLISIARTINALPFEIRKVRPQLVQVIQSKDPAVEHQLNALANEVERLQTQNRSQARELIDLSNWKDRSPDEAAEEITKISDVVGVEVNLLKRSLDVNINVVGIMEWILNKAQTYLDVQGSH